MRSGRRGGQWATIMIEPGLARPPAGPHPFDSRQASTPVVAALRGTALRLTRFRADATLPPQHYCAPRQEGFYAILQLRDHAPHPFWLDGRAAPTPGSPRGSLHIVDLRGGGTALLRGPFDSLNLELPRAALDALAEQAGVPRGGSLRVPEAWQTRDARMRQLQPLLLAALEEPGSPLFTDQLLLATALHLAETYGGLRRQPLRPGALAPWQERRARELIAARLAQPLPLAALAAECGLSPAHFAKAFKAGTGLTPHGWLQQCRLERARALLRQPGMALAEVAQRSGFADQSHFTRIFRRATGQSPGAWRRQQG